MSASLVGILNVSPQIVETRYIFEILVAIVVLLGTAKSAYNGYVRDFFLDIQRISAVAARVERLEKRQERVIDSVVALAHVEKEDDSEINPREVRETLDRVDRSMSYVDDHGSSGHRHRPDARDDGDD